MNMQEFMGLLATYGAAEVRLTVEVTKAEVLPVEEAMDEDAEECGCGGCCGEQGCGNCGNTEGVPEKEECGSGRVHDSGCSGNCGETGCCPPGHFCENRCANTERVQEKCEGGCSDNPAKRALLGTCEGCTNETQSQWKKTQKADPTESAKKESDRCVAQVVRVSVRKV